VSDRFQENKAQQIIRREPKVLAFERSERMRAAG
jgi:hypothetical protein